MKKTLTLALTLMLLISVLFVLTGCGKKENMNNRKNENLESTQTINIEDINDISSNETSLIKKEEFTQTVSLEEFNIEYKLPNNSMSEYDFEDMGCSIILDIEEHETDDHILHINDSKAEMIEITDINGFSYEHYKYFQDDDNVTYIYRTQANGKYYLFKYSVLGKNYDDSQVAKFMNTVIYK